MLVSRAAIATAVTASDAAHGGPFVLDGNMPEKPLADVTLVLSAAERELDGWQRRVGFRTVEVRGQDMLVNGTVVLDEGKHTNARPGKVLKRPAGGGSGSPRGGSRWPRPLRGRRRIRRSIRCRLPRPAPGIWRKPNGCCGA